jgi:hypothetical protein
MSNNDIGGYARKFMQDHEGQDWPKSSARERQLTAQAINLHVDFIDGRRAEGFAWAHYVGYEWQDESGEERLTVLFGPRAVEIFGKNLGALIDDIREGRLNRIRELPGARRKQLEADNPDNEPVIRAIKVYPDFRAMLEEIKGEYDEQHTRHAKRA